MWAFKLLIEQVQINDVKLKQGTTNNKDRSVVKTDKTSEVNAMGKSKWMLKKRKS